MSQGERMQKGRRAHSGVGVLVGSRNVLSKIVVPIFSRAGWQLTKKRALSPFPMLSPWQKFKIKNLVRSANLHKEVKKQEINLAISQMAACTKT